VSEGGLGLYSIEQSVDSIDYSHSGWFSKGKARW
jgi:anti-sigma regulatory factor (Ser/Thr protein kinase)